jgi:G3E family GTPase
MDKDYPMEILLITGFLGTGKTTLIRHLLHSPFPRAGKIAVLVNEFGKIGIDGKLLSGLNVEIIELASGCICCTIKTDFFKAVREIHERLRPDFLLVETTGIAQPGEILDVLCTPPLMDFCRVRSIITIVDAGFFQAREILGPFYARQIQGADILLLNKVDLVEGTRVQEVEGNLREMNPSARIFPTIHCVVDVSNLTGDLSATRQKPVQAQDHLPDSTGDAFQTISFQDEGALDREKLTHFLESLRPNIFRVKGWVRFLDSSAFVDFSGGRFRISPIDNLHPTSLVLIGRKFSEAGILKNLRDCLTEEANGAKSP